MDKSEMTRLGRILCLALTASAALAVASSCSRRTPDSATPAVEPVVAPVMPRPACDPGNGGLTLPAGFCATVFADNLGHTRHIAAAPSGDVYANTSSSKNNEMTNAPGGYIVALRDADGDGHAEVVERFGSIHQEGKPGGGTGIGVHDGALYVEVDDKIVRYPLAAGVLSPAGEPTVVVTGLPQDGDHTMHPFAIGPSGTMFVNSGSASNACQVKNRTLKSRGQVPCRELATRAGIWRYDAKADGQVFSPAARYATGMRNTVAPAVHSDGSLYSAVHGRDQLSENWPALYTEAQNNELPAEIFSRVEEKDDFGWPQCYYDAAQGKNVLAPEYGGDGGKAQGECGNRKRPDVAFPAHWAPEAVAFYSGTTFPAKYQGGAFVSFHGSWNRKPAQAGFLVAFVPFSGGKPSSTYEEFATGFAGPQPPADPKQAPHRPMGLAVGTDGALYVSDDVKGRIWRITYAP